MIEKTANTIANAIADNITDYTQLSQILSARRHKEYKLLSKDEVIEVLQYGLEGFLGDFIKSLIILTIGILFNILIPAIFIMLAFCTLRLLAGGFHMDNYSKCLSTGSILFLVPAWFIQYYNSYLTVNYKFIMISILISFIIVYMYAPVDSENKPLTNNDKIKYKFKSLFYVYVLANILVLISNNLIKVSILTGLIIELFTITPIGIKIFNTIELIINKISSKLIKSKGSKN